MKNRTNYHSHCSFCDGRASMEDFVQAAIKGGFTSYGISSHAPLPFSTRWALDRSDVQSYIEEFRRLKSLYHAEIELYLGMEIDYLDEENHPGNDFFQALPLDYRIGSLHLLHSVSGEVVDIDTSGEIFKESVATKLGGDLKQVVLSYFDKLMQMVSTGGFDLLGHADKISMNALYCQPGITQEKWYTDKIHEYFHLIAEKELTVEINTKAWSQTGLFFPNRAHFPLLNRLHIPLTVNSDAHFPDRINDGRDEALLALFEVGIRTVRQLESGTWRDVEINLEE